MTIEEDDYSSNIKENKLAKSNVMAMNNPNHNIQGANVQANNIQGANVQANNTPELTYEPPIKKDNGKYDTPPNMVYNPNGGNRHYANILGNALADDAATKRAFTKRGEVGNAP